MILFPLAHALTLEAAVQRAAEVDPDALVAGLVAAQGRLDASEKLWNAGVSVNAGLSRTWSGGMVSDSGALRASVPIFDVGRWFDVAQERAQARQLDQIASGTTLDAQYTAAGLYFGALSADAALDAAKQGYTVAEATARATQARVSAGLESELVGRSAELGRLTAEARVAQAESDREIARMALARALEVDAAEVEALERPATLDLPVEIADSPWIAAQEAALRAAKLGHDQRLGELLPTAELAVSTNLVRSLGAAPFTDWAVTLGGAWSFDGLAGPFIRERSARIDVRIEEIGSDRLRRDLELALFSARSSARAADRVADAAQARAKLAEESLQIGEARLAAGLASPLEVLRLQDDAAAARSDRVSAELGQALARLEARRVAGLPW